MSKETTFEERLKARLAQMDKEPKEPKEPKTPISNAQKARNRTNYANRTVEQKELARTRDRERYYRAHPNAKKLSDDVRQRRLVLLECMHK